MSICSRRTRHVLCFVLVLIAAQTWPGSANALDRLLSLGLIPLKPKINQFCEQAKQATDVSHLQTMLQSLTSDLAKAQADYEAATKAAEDANLQWQASLEVQKNNQANVDHLRVLTKSTLLIPEEKEQLSTWLRQREDLLVRLTTMTGIWESAKSQLHMATYKKEAARNAFGQSIKCVNARIEELKQVAVTPPPAGSAEAPPASKKCTLGGRVPDVQILAFRDTVCDFELMAGYDGPNPDLIQPKNGTVEWRAGHVIYQPAPGWQGRDHFALSGPWTAATGGESQQITITFSVDVQ